MASDSDGKLTKFESTVTVVTSDFANSMFGGLYGSGGASALDDGLGAGEGTEDPRVRGHIHDGEKIDGHAKRIDLVQHVESQLRHQNLGTEAVKKRNVYHSEGLGGQALAIPEYDEEDGTGVDEDGEDIPEGTYYYLDLRAIRSDFTFHEIEEPTDGNHRLIRQRKDEEVDSSWDDNYGYDFVFGSESLDDLESPGTNNYGDERFQFDKSRGAFRAGSVMGDEWDDSNRGTYSVAFGRNSLASGTNSVVGGGMSCSATAQNTVVGGGYDNNVTSVKSTIGGGYENNITSYGATIGGGQQINIDGNYGVVGGGHINTVNGNWSTIGGGASITIDGHHTTVGGGEFITADGDYAVVGGGQTNTADGDYAVVGGGDNCHADSTSATVGGGSTNNASDSYATISGGWTNTASSEASTVSGGSTNTASSEASTVSGGSTNKILDDSDYSTISGGENNDVGLTPHDLGATAPCPHSTVSGGSDNNILDGSTHSVIGGGENNDIGQDNNDAAAPGVAAPCTHSAIGGGSENNILDGSTHSTIGGGEDNDIGVFDELTPSTHSAIGGGEDNDIYGGSTHSAIGGGESNDIFGASVHSVVGGGDNNNIYGASTSSVIGGGLTNNVSGAPRATISGGSENTITGDAATISGGEGNTASGSKAVIGGGGGLNTDEGNIASGNQSTISGGWHNIASAPGSIVAGGEGNKAESSFSFVAGNRNIVGEASEFSTIVSGGGPAPVPLSGDPDPKNTINHYFETYIVDGSGSPYPVGVAPPNPPDAPTTYSAIFGGSGNKINGGPPDTSGVTPVTIAKYNYILGGQGNQMAGLDNSLQYCSISFGVDNEIVTANALSTDCHIGYGSGNLIYATTTSSIDNTYILSGIENVVQAAQAPIGDINASVIVSGEKNRLTTGQAEGTISHCSVLGGYLNIFDSGNTHDVSDFEGGHSTGFGGQTSSILGGSQNKILSAGSDPTLFSSILGGFVNSIESCRGSVICGGGAPVDLTTPIVGTGIPYPPYWPEGTPGSADPSGGNKIYQSNYSSILGGSGNIISAANLCSITHGKENAVIKSSYGEPPFFASAGGKLSQSYSLGQVSQASGDFELDDDYFQGKYSDSGGSGGGLYGGGPGSAQTFVLTMLGHWEYESSAFSSWPGIDPYFKCYLDGYDFQSSPSRLFIPRQSSSYAFTIQGTLSCTKLPSTHHTVAFTYKGGIQCNGDGTFTYGAIDIEEHYTTSAGPTISNDSSTSPDFYIYFTADPSTPGREGSGIATTASSTGTPDGFHIWVQNSSGGTYGAESLVARVEMTECKLYYVIS